MLQLTSDFETARALGREPGRERANAHAPGEEREPLTQGATEAATRVLLEQLALAEV